MRKKEIRDEYFAKEDGTVDDDDVRKSKRMLNSIVSAYLVTVIVWNLFRSNFVSPLKLRALGFIFLLLALLLLLCMWNQEKLKSGFSKIKLFFFLVLFFFSIF